MANKKINGFLSSISSTRGLSDLRKKLKSSDNDNCPIRTLSQLIDPSMAVPKTNVSLRSLRMKPSSKPATRQANNVTDRSEQSSTILNATKENGGCSVNGMVTTNSVREATVEPFNDNHVFAVPTMRAPRPLKREPDYWTKELHKALSFAWFTLAKDDFQRLCHVLIVHILNIIEEENSSADDLRDNSQQELFQAINSWMNKIASPEYIDVNGQSYPEGPGFRDIDNISSVSGYAPSNLPGYINIPCMQDQRNTMANANCTAQFRNFDHGNTGSIYGYNNMSRYGAPSVGNNTMVSNDVPCLLPAFVKQRLHSDSSVIGSMYGGPAIPMENYGNQTSFFHSNQNQSVMGGYPAHLMNVRPDVSSVPIYTVRDQVNANCSMMSSVPNHRINQTGQMHMEERMEGNQMNHYSQRNMGSSFLNRCNTVPFNSDRSTASFQNYHDRTSRNVMAPLQPVVTLNRVNVAENFNQEQGYDNRDMEERSSERFFRGRSNMSFNKTTAQVRNPLRPVDNVRDFSALRAVSRRVDGVENSELGTRLRSQNTMARHTPNLRPKTQSVGQNLIPGTPARGNIMDTSGAVRVTRSGRAVRAPQHYWSSDASIVSAACNNNTTVQGRGIKRKRN